MLIRCAAALLLLSAVAPALSAPRKPAPTPSEIVAAAPPTDWARIAPADLLVMELAPDAKGRARRVVIQLVPPPFSTAWTANIRKLVAAKWFDGIAVVRVQDNYVVQWGDADGDDKAKAKPLPPGLASTAEADYTAPATAAPDFVLPGRDPYARGTGAEKGWPVAFAKDRMWPVHCYGMVGVGRNVSPDAGTGAELYTVIGHAPRALDRNIALVGRVVEGIEHLSSLPRGTGNLGFYESAAERTAIRSVRIGNEVAGLPAFEAMVPTSASFAAYAKAKANRKDAFFIAPAGGVDVCALGVPLRRAK